MSISNQGQETFVSRSGDVNFPSLKTLRGSAGVTVWNVVNVNEMSQGAKDVTQNASFNDVTPSATINVTPSDASSGNKVCSKHQCVSSDR